MVKKRRTVTICEESTESKIKVYFEILEGEEREGGRRVRRMERWEGKRRQEKKKREIPKGWRIGKKERRTSKRDQNTKEQKKPYNIMCERQIEFMKNYKITKTVNLEQRGLAEISLMDDSNKMDHWDENFGSGRGVRKWHENTVKKLFSYLKLLVHFQRFHCIA